MPDAEKTVTLDVFLLTLSVPHDLPDAAVAKVRRALGRPTFSVRLHDAVVDLLRRFPSLTVVTATVSR